MTRAGSDELAALDATGLAAAIRARQISAREAADAALDAIARRDPELNCFTAVTAERALADAARVDQQLARGEDPGPLAGVPFGAKDLFDIAGVTTLAGSKILRDQPPAARDAVAVAAFAGAGAVLCGALNMDEFAYGFVTENAHYGPTRNPHDRRRIAGGSSGGSAAAVAAGLLPLTLGTDTNGSIRVPASLCGIFGLKPTYGRISHAGAFPFASSLDHIGPFARSARDLALAFDVLQAGAVASSSARQAPEWTRPALALGADGLRVATLGGYFAEGAEPEAFAAVEKVARALGAKRCVELPKSELARAAAFLITAIEGGQLHLPWLRERPHDYDPATRDRLLAGALLPAAWGVHAQRFRTWFRERAREIFADGVDILLAPATPCAATEIGQATMVLAGRELPVRPNMGWFTQPISFIGLPVVAVPTWPSGTPGEGLPIGVQIIAAPGREREALRIAAALEAAGVCACAAIAAA
jgi:AtzE family amidohydrolase